MLHLTKTHADCRTTRAESACLQGVGTRFESVCTGRMQSVAQIKPFNSDPSPCGRRRPTLIYRQKKAGPEPRFLHLSLNYGL
jgi:hypothetical protein